MSTLPLLTGVSQPNPGGRMHGETVARKPSARRRRRGQFGRPGGGHFGRPASGHFGRTAGGQLGRPGGSRTVRSGRSLWPTPARSLWPIRGRSLSVTLEGTHTAVCDKRRTATANGPGRPLGVVGRSGEFLGRAESGLTLGNGRRALWSLHTGALRRFHERRAWASSGGRGRVSRKRLACTANGYGERPRAAPGGRGSLGGVPRSSRVWADARERQAGSVVAPHRGASPLPRAADVGEFVGT
jgi:hypothetical protein